MKINGHHHISMYTKDVKQNKDFYTNILGLRLVEISVNQDNPTMYHFFYGDEEGSPGTLLSFFEIPNASMTKKGTNSIHRLSLLVPDQAALKYFEQRLNQHGIETHPIHYAGHDGLIFEDRDALEIVLLPNNDMTYPNAWKKNHYSDIPEAYQILGMGPVELRVRGIEKSAQFLTETLGYTRRIDSNIFTLDANGLYSDFVVVEQDGHTVTPGRGYVHHIAVDMPGEQDLEALIEKLDQLPGKHTGIIDRWFFKSVYYRQNGIMFEFATSGPGFMVDTKKEDLGKKLNLPEFLEKDRAEILKALKPIE
ncbi:VOC family protein [Macrococcoides canis]|uniref:VOC family protein n=1 Tax=Macrococcoides canis TaxID=1855823 RepID=UPI0020B7D98E|nr:VOC family protein [Macrococcus canis]UTH02543.1 VOC family protein [Macrococcus canis]